MDAQGPTHSSRSTGPEPDAVAAARRMFNRTLQSWTMDLLSLRVRRLDRPGVRRVRGLACPSRGRAPHAAG